ncbi:MAG TPA: ClpX C4-type zinc finger protein [Bryobacteraceae bacterium]
MLWTRTYVDDDRVCSFCRKPKTETGELIASPGSPRRYICAACVGVCNGILEDRSGTHGRLQPGHPVTVKYRYDKPPTR